MKYLNQISKNFDLKNKNKIKLNNLKNLSLKISNNIYKNLLKLKSHYNRYFKNFSINNLITPDSNTSHKFTNSKINNYIDNFKYIKNITNLLPAINNHTTINNYKKFEIFNIKKKTLLINSNKINTLTFKFNKLYSTNNITITTSYNRSKSRDLINYTKINLSYKPNLINFKKFLNFKKKLNFLKQTYKKNKLFLNI